MHKNGFCKLHGSERGVCPQPPVDLIKCTEIIIPHLLYRILQYLRSNYIESKSVK
jgi:hypothetical protein